jgi:uncharacterized protein
VLENLSEGISKQIRGAGLGFRPQYLKDIEEAKHEIGWLEILIDNYLYRSDNEHERFAALFQSYPIVFHTVGMDLAGPCAVDMNYLSRVKKLAAVYQPTWISDHLCWSSTGQKFHHDLLPFPYTKKTLKTVSERIDRVQNVLGQAILLENISYYIQFKESELSEAEFLNELTLKTGCGILLDLNNIYVNWLNIGLDINLFLDQLPKNAVRQLHVAGFSPQEGIKVDDHGGAPSAFVLDLLRDFLLSQKAASIPPAPALLEWDSFLPDFSSLLYEYNKVQGVYENLAR